MRMFHQRKAMANSLGTKQSSVVQVRILGVAGTACIQQSLASMEQERDLERFSIDHCILTGFLECEKFFSVIANVIRPIFRTDKIESWEISQLSSRWS